MSSALLADRPELLKERLRQVPESPGVYVMRDEKTRVIYVGKAMNLRNRLRSYFVAAGPAHPRTAQMVKRVFDFDVLTSATDQEALLLECTLIKRYRPRYNVRLRDDKNYLYMKVPRAGDFPRVYTVRKVGDDGARYFGPFTNAGALRTTMKTLRRIFPYRTCSDDVFKRGRVCLDYHIKRCSGPCEGLIDTADYHQNLEQIGVFMEGRPDELLRDIRHDMQGASDALDFERAARLRDRASALEKVAQRQWVLSQSARDQDVLGLARAAGAAMVAVLTVRKGQVVGSETFELEGPAEMEAAEIVNGFAGQFYGDATSYPREVLVPQPIADAEPLAAWMSGRRGARVRIHVPLRGSGVRLLEMAEKNAEEALTQSTIKKDYDSERAEKLLADLQEALGLDRTPRRIECYDISNLMGTDPVGSMVVFEDGRPRPAHYRRFHIKGVKGANDFAMLQEMLRRRFTRLVSVRGDRLEGEPGDDSFESLPDLVIVDGGKGQLSAAREMMEELGVHQIATFGLAKQKEELIPTGGGPSLMLPLGSPALFLVQRVRDEAHRFAISFHRRTRAKERLASPLDAVAGLGPKRKRQLIKRFRSLAGIREASLTELAEVVPEKVAAAIKEQL
ncbi:MAG TPA: excinuclease ABC subunit UvrC [Candidatus Dormibacteraeota bacterium]|nr:excinuclease ABC subunit UvrC [Candidatus Dormibacteraeota bacterium]